MTTRIRKPQNSLQELCSALERFSRLLDDQGEEAAAADLRVAKHQIETATTEDHTTVLASILEAFEGDHELCAYTFHKTKNPEEWTVADELFLASTEVLTLVKRLYRG